MVIAWYWLAAVGTWCVIAVLVAIPVGRHLDRKADQPPPMPEDPNAD